MDLDIADNDFTFTCSFELFETLLKLKAEVEKLLKFSKKHLFQLESWKVLLTKCVLNFDFQAQ